MSNSQKPNAPRAQNNASQNNAPRGYEYEYPRAPAPPPPSRATTPAPNALPERSASSPYVSRGAEYNAPAARIAPSAKRNRARVWLTRFIFFALGSILFLMCGGLALAGGAYFYYANELPPADKLATVNTSQSTKIYDRNGGLLYEIADPNLGRHTIIPPEKIPPVLKQATLATEDPSFYTNPGVDFYGLARAIYYLVRYQRPVSGASTITQQLIKTALLSPEQTVERKIKEAILAFEVTRRYSKDEILAFYLNTINYGNHSYGIQAAAQSYFSKDVTQLNLAEASMLAGLPQLPAIYDPCINPDRALERQRIVLSLMQEQGMLQQAQADAAAQEMTQRVTSDAFINNCKAGLNYTRAPHFVDYVREQLQARYGSSADNAGLHVYTTLDPQVQNIVEQEARKQIAALKNKNVNSAAAVAVNPRSGEILAMLGSVDFNDEKIDGQVNVATRLRQPGSSIKPITYVAAFEKGWTPATPLYDLTTEFPNGAQPPYVPKNYDGKEHGLVSARTALANSYNIPAVKTLYFVGVPQMMGVAQRMGITSFNDPNRYGLALTLGGGEVKLTELTGAYAAFANQGKRAPLSPFLKIVDGAGRTIYDAASSDAQPEQVLDTRHAYLITNILADNVARTPAFGANSPLKTSRPTFVKTGTTNDYKDNWTLGGTNEFVLGVWVGNPRNQPMQNVSGVTGAAPIWHNVVERVYQEADEFKNIPAHALNIPSGLVQVQVCNESGLVPNENCPADHRHDEIFLNTQAPQTFDDVWTKLKIDTTNNLLANENCAREIVEERVFANLQQDGVLPYDRIRAWGAANGYPIAPIESSPCTNIVPATAEPVQVKINRPEQGVQVSGTVSVNGSVRVPQGGTWILEVGRAGRWETIASGSAEARGKLGQFDSSIYGEGELDIRLTATDQWGQPREDKVRVYVIFVPPPSATAEPTRRPKKTATPEPTLVIETPIPTQEPTIEPTLEPTIEPTIEPTMEPTATATQSPEPTATASPEPTKEIPVTPTTQP